MTRNLIIESIGRPIEADFSKTVVAHARNSVILAQTIGADLITGDKDIHLTEGKTYDNIICCYASPYMKYKLLIDVIRNSPDAKLWWFVNDHDLEDNILLRNVLKETDGKRTFSMICNNERESYRGWIRRKKMKDSKGEYMGILDDFIDEWHTLNLNAMIYNYTSDYNWDDKKQSYNLLGESQNESVYWGTMRKHRMNDFIEYQDAGITFSATPKTQTKLVKAGLSGYYYVDKLSWKRGHEDLNKYKFSLYIEDEHTHDHYAHMANRFYEGLMFNVITLFDHKCRKVIEESFFDVSEMFIVKNAQEFRSAVALMSDQYGFELALQENEDHKIIAEHEHIMVIGELINIFK